MIPLRPMRRPLAFVQALRSCPRNAQRSILSCSSATSTGRERTKKPPRQQPDLAFAFDIDGVLLRSSTPIPRARRALELLDKNNIPYVLLTNGGGKREDDRTADLRARLGGRLAITPANFIQSHTPFRTLRHLQVGAEAAGPAAKRKPNEAVLVLGGSGGGHGCRLVAESYGFSNVVTSADLYTAEPGLWPFAAHLADYYAAHSRPLPAPVFKPSLESAKLPGDGSSCHAEHSAHVGACVPFPAPDSVEAVLDRHLRISAVLVFTDPFDWALDCSIVTDLLLSHRGHLGTHSAANGARPELPHRGFLAAGPPPVLFSNGDLWWAASWQLPRFGQGGFREALEGCWRRLTSGSPGFDPLPPAGATVADEVPLPKEIWGKPAQRTYDFAEDVLADWWGKLVGEERRMRRVYMVGDNPESDIRGANQFRSRRGLQWSSILVRTGVYQPGNIDGSKDPYDAVASAYSSPACRPTAIVDDVYDAVRWALTDAGVELGQEDE